MATSVSWRLCKYPGCTKSRYQEPSGYTHDFCGRTHADMMTRATRFTSPTSSSSTYLTSSSKSKKPSGLGPLKAFQSFVKPSKSNEIKFYNKFDNYYQFTNFYLPVVPIKIDGVFWPSSEHYFQAQKFVGTPFVEKIRKMSSARETFQFSRNPVVSHWQRSDWDQVKDDVMLKALRCKFGQSESLCSLLVSTGDKVLIEHTENDSYWGDGGDGKGQNKLGKLLMKVRGELQHKQASVSKGNSKSPLKRRNSFSIPSRKESKPKYTDDMGIISSKPSESSYSLRRSGSFSSLAPSQRDTDVHVLSAGKRLTGLCGKQTNSRPLPTYTKTTTYSTQTSSRYHPTYTKTTPVHIPTPSRHTSTRSSSRKNDSTQMKTLLIGRPPYTYKTTAL